MRLVPCDGCARHVRETEVACPFCAHPRAILSVALQISKRRANGLVRTALAASALLTVACGNAEPSTSATNEPPSSTGDETETETEAPTEAETETRTPPPRGPDGPGAIAAYGGPSLETPSPTPPPQR